LADGGAAGGTGLVGGFGMYSGPGWPQAASRAAAQAAALSLSAIVDFTIRITV